MHHFAFTLVSTIKENQRNVYAIRAVINDANECVMMHNRKYHGRLLSGLVRLIPHEEMQLLLPMSVHRESHCVLIDCLLMSRVKAYELTLNLVRRSC